MMDLQSADFVFFSKTKKLSQNSVAVTGSPFLSAGFHLFFSKRIKHRCPPHFTTMSLPSPLFSSFQLDSDIYVHLLGATVRHLEGPPPSLRPLLT